MTGKNMVKGLRKQICEKALQEELEGADDNDKEVIFRAFDFIKTGKGLNEYLERDGQCMQGITDWGCDVRQAYNNMQRCARMIAHSYGLSF